MKTGNFPTTLEEDLLSNPIHCFFSSSETPVIQMFRSFVIALQFYEPLLIFFSSLFSLCYSDWEIHVLGSLLLILISVIFVLLLSLSSDLFILIIVFFFSVLKLLLVSIFWFLFFWTQTSYFWFVLSMFVIVEWSIFMTTALKILVSWFRHLRCLSLVSSDCLFSFRLRFSWFLVWWLILLESGHFGYYVVRLWS